MKGGRTNGSCVRGRDGSERHSAAPQHARRIDPSGPTLGLGLEGCNENTLGWCVRVPVGDARRTFEANSYLNGSLPTELGTLSTLKSLDLRDSSFSGSLPTELGSLSLVTVLDLSAARNLTGTIPTELGKLTNLFGLALSNLWSVNGSIPTEVRPRDATILPSP